MLNSGQSKCVPFVLVIFYKCAELFFGSKLVALLVGLNVNPINYKKKHSHYSIPRKNTYNL